LTIKPENTIITPMSKPKRKHEIPLTWRQHAFAKAYASDAKGNATLACKIAGYKGTDDTLGKQGNRNLSLPKIRQEINRQKAKLEHETRDERDKTLQVLQGIRDNPDANDRDRIAASKEIGDLSGWHSTTIQLEAPARQAEMDQAALEAAEKASRLLTSTRLLPDGSTIPCPNFAELAGRQGLSEAIDAELVEDRPEPPADEPTP
jgi:phage terminase small subunit